MSRIDRDKMAQHLSQMLQCKTISNSDPKLVDDQEFLKLHRVLQQCYPLIHKNLEKQVITNNGLLYRWKGKGGNKPVLFMAHQDVVPAGQQGWDHPPFSGDITQHCVWGRGAIDIKVMICAEMEAVEYLLEQGFQPESDVYLAYGSDEEVNDKHSAKDIANALEKQGVKLAMVLDEGTSFSAGEVYDAPGKTLACIGICEKGYLDVMLSVSSPGGHASRPLPVSALGELARAIVAVQSMDMPLVHTEFTQRFFSTLQPYMQDGKMKECVDKLGTDKNGFYHGLAQNRSTMPMVQTTVAATMAQGSPAPNVLPQSAQAVINFRLMPGVTVQEIVAKCEQAVANRNVKVTAMQADEASKISDINGKAYNLIAHMVQEIYPEVMVLPAMVLGATDSRAYQSICEDIFKFVPIMSGMDLGHTVHGVNERMPLQGMEKGAEFFVGVIENLDKLE